MAKIKVTYGKEFDSLIDKLEMLGAQIMPNLAHAINVSASFVLKTWVDIAQGNDDTNKPSGLNFSGSIDYANSIRIQSLGAFHKIVYSDSNIGKKLSKGTPSYDMKPFLVNGKKSRINKQGERYNSIPFRHKVKDLKKKTYNGQSLYDMAKSLTKQKITGFRIDSEGKKRFTYGKWTKDKILNIDSRRYAGMVRVETSAGSGYTSQYLTFRVVKLSQVGKWIYPARPAWDILGAVRQKTEPKIRQWVQDGIKKDFNLKE